MNHTQIAKLLDIIWNYINTKNVAKASDSCQALNKNYPENADGWYATSFLAFQMRNTSLALSAIDKAIDLQPLEPKWQVHKAHTLVIASHKQAALSLLNSLADKTYQDAQLCAELALVLNKLTCYQQSEKQYLQATKLDPNNAQLYFNLASVQRYLGKINEADISLTRCILLNHHDYEAHLLRSSLHVQTEQKNHIKGLKALLEKGINSAIGKTQICYALAKELEDLKQYNESFEYLTLGANTRRKNMRYDVNNDIDTLTKIVDAFDKTLFENSNKGYENNEAIFILGLPRTGSTLVERIISSHDQVQNAGELNNFALQMLNEVQTLTTTPPSSRQALVELTKSLNFESLGKAYIESTRPETGSKKHFIDKLPLNSLYVGLIHLALPNAKIVYVKRNPLDTIYAMYKQMFTNGYPFSYDLNELTRYYIAHHKLMKHWCEVIPHAIYQISYEDLVEDVSNESKKLIEYCQLDWQAQCGNFHQNSAPSTTASSVQIRQPIYKTSYGKWRHFEQQLTEVKTQLEQAGIL